MAGGDMKKEGLEEMFDISEYEKEITEEEVEMKLAC